MSDVHVYSHLDPMDTIWTKGVHVYGPGLSAPPEPLPLTTCPWSSSDSSTSTSSSSRHRHVTLTTTERRFAGDLILGRGTAMDAL